MPEFSRLCHPDHSVLLVIDIQERLASAMPKEDLERLIKNTSILMQAARHLDIPVLSTEQYPKGLGNTLPEIRQHYPDEVNCLHKTGFSCCAAEGFTERLSRFNRKQVVLTGMETHICVLQTATELQDNGYNVFVAEDAVCSRSARRMQNGLARMRQMDIMITHSESVLFEWLRDARHPQFKTVSSLLK